VTQPNQENCKNSSSKCAYDCAQLQYTIQHSSDNLSSYLQTNIIAQMLSIGEEGRLLTFVCGLTMNRQKASMSMVPIPVFLPLLLLLEMVVLMTAREVSVQVVSFNDVRNVRNGPVRCALDTANETSSSSSLEDCSNNCADDGTCAGFNIKNSTTCDHVMTPVLVSTSRTQPPVITW